MGVLESVGRVRYYFQYFCPFIPYREPMYRIGRNFLPCIGLRREASLRVAAVSTSSHSMPEKRKLMKIGTHNGRFHCDEVQSHKSILTQSAGLSLLFLSSPPLLLSSSSFQGRFPYITSSHAGPWLLSTSPVASVRRRRVGPDPRRREAERLRRRHRRRWCLRPFVPPLRPPPEGISRQFWPRLYHPSVFSGSGLQTFRSGHHRSASFQTCPGSDCRPALPSTLQAVHRSP